MYVQRGSEMSVCMRGCTHARTHGFSRESLDDANVEIWPGLVSGLGYLGSWSLIFDLGHAPLFNTPPRLTEQLKCFLARDSSYTTHHASILSFLFRCWQAFSVSLASRSPSVWMCRVGYRNALVLAA